MARPKRVRIIKKIREPSGVWRFASLERIGARYGWTRGPGVISFEWWQGKKRRRQTAGQTPSEVLEAQRRKRNELIGQILSGGAAPPLSAVTASVVTVASMSRPLFFRASRSYQSRLVLHSDKTRR